jgi:hypothetical protein
MQSLIGLVERWRQEGIAVLPPAIPTDVRDTFAAVGSVATSDVIALYALIGGMDRMDDEYWPRAERSGSEYRRVFRSIFI